MVYYDRNMELGKKMSRQNTSVNQAVLDVLDLEKPKPLDLIIQKISYNYSFNDSVIINAVQSLANNNIIDGNDGAGYKLRLVQDDEIDSLANY